MSEGPSWQAGWNEIRKAISRKVSEFNSKGGRQFTISPTADVLIQVVDSGTGVSKTGTE